MRNKLHDAAASGNIDSVKSLVEQDVDIDTQDAYGKTPLMYAAENGHLDVVQYLVKQGADKKKQDNGGRIPLVVAADKGKHEVAWYLFEQGVDKAAEDDDGNTPLLEAARWGHLDMVRFLVEQGADKDTKNEYGKTSLICMLENGHLGLVKEVCKIGSKDQWFPLHFCLVKEYATKPLVSRGEPEAEDPTWFISSDDVTKVGTVLAVGGFGTVYLAMWADSDVVVKEVSVVELRRFLKEVDTWRNLRHANVVPFYGANHRKEPYFIISQYATKGELVPYLKREKQQGRSVVWRKLKEVAAGLGYLHSQEVVHGDLKGNNIVVSNDGTAMLTDFGLSFQESGSCSVKKMKDTLGAMAWRAPEFANMTILTPTRKSECTHWECVLLRQ
ncbi:Ankyrin repeat-containing domain [Phytophthora cactorum]|nr:Ankyrin repeat-containing domain [Phytophthora cactorum]